MGIPDLPHAIEFVPLDPPWDHTFVLVGSFVLLVVGGELFTTGVEWIGNRAGMDESATGSVLAALATTLPEALIPVVAILAGSGATVGVGSIVGGPLMLTTVAPFVVGAAAFYYAKRGDRSPRVTIELGGATRDLRVFLFGFGVVLVTIFASRRWVLVACGVLVVGVYGWYLYRTLRSGLAEGGEAAVEPLEIGKLLDRAGVGRSTFPYAERPPNGLVALQALLAVGLLLVGSNAFVAEIEWFSTHVLATPALITALLAAPLASNVPEGIDGLIWIGRGRDTLAVDQITGTLAFQGTVLAALGMTFTPWSIKPRWGTVGFLTTTAVAGALAAGTVVYVLVRRADGDGIDPRPLLALGVVYLAFLGLVGYYVVAGYVG